MEREMEDIAIGLRRVVARSGVAVDAGALGQLSDAIYPFPNNTLSDYCDQ
jgi:hypothetical protein